MKHKEIIVIAKYIVMGNLSEITFNLRSNNQSKEIVKCKLLSQGCWSVHPQECLIILY